jgi:hypothetical protein
VIQITESHNRFQAIIIYPICLYVKALSLMLRENELAKLTKRDVESVEYIADLVYLCLLTVVLNIRQRQFNRKILNEKIPVSPFELQLARSALCVWCH